MSDIVINGITYPEPKRVAFPGSDGKPVIFDLPTEAEPVLNSISTRPPQTKAVFAADEEIRQMISSPYNTGEAVADLDALEAIQDPAVNEAHYVVSESCRYGWTGTKWTQVSMDESQYADELTEVGNGLEAVSNALPGLDVAWVIEGVDTRTGDNNTSDKRLRTGRLDISSVLTVTAGAGTGFVLFFYSPSAYLGYDGLHEGMVSVAARAQAKGYTAATQVKIVARYTDNRVIEDADDLSARIHLGTSADKAAGGLVSRYSPSARSWWTVGGLYAATGKIKLAANRCTNLCFAPVSELHHVVTDETTSAALFFYSARDDDTFVGASGVLSGAIDVAEQAAALENANYCRVVARYNDNSDIADAEDIAARVRLAGYFLPDFAQLGESDLHHTSGAFWGLRPVLISYDSGTESASTDSCSSEMVPLDGFYRIRAAGNVRISSRCYAKGVYLGTHMFSWGTEIRREDVRSAYPAADAVRVCAIYADRTAITDLDDVASKIILDALQPIRTVEPELELGSYSTVSSQFLESDTRIRHKFPIPAGHVILIKWPAAYQMSYRTLSGDYQYLGYADAWLDTSFFALDSSSAPGVGYLTILFRRPDDRVLTDEDIAALESGLRIVVAGAPEPESLRFELSAPVLLQSITDTEPMSPVMCSVKYQREPGKLPVPIGWLFRDTAEPYSFYWSADGRTLEPLFRWNKAVTDNGKRTPMEYTCMISDEGDIVCVYRGELAYARGESDLRQNPIVYPHGDYEHPVMVDFGESDPPINGVLDTGYYVESGRIFIAEYTRYRHTHAYVWRVSAPYTSRSDWEKIRTFQVSGNIHGFKHCHYIDRDIYTGILWLSTGDIPPSEGETYVGTPGIYYSTDNGTTWSTLIEGSEKYCRQLGFVWTKDYVYWASDTANSARHFLMRARRKSSGVIDIDSVEDLWQWYTGQATYSLCYSESPHGILFLDHIDYDGEVPLNVYFWDLDLERMRYLGRIDPVGRGFLGFRVEAVNHFPAPGNMGYLCGFGLNQSFIRMPGMKYLENHDTTSNGYTYADADNTGCLNNILIRLVQ